MAKKNGTATVATATPTAEKKDDKPIKNRAEGLKVVASLSVDPHKCRLTDKFRGRSAPVADEDVIALADSISSTGQQQPVQLRQVEGTDEYETIFGNTRVRACQLIKNGYIRGDGRTVEPKADFTIRAEVVECSDEEAFKRNLVENNDRLMCSPIDNMKNQQALRDLYGMSDAAIARLYGFSHSVTVHNLKKLQNLAEPYQDMIHKGEMTVSAGLKLCDFSENVQEKIMKLAIDDSDESGIRYGATQIIDAIKKFKAAEKEASTPAPEGEATSEGGTTLDGGTTSEGESQTPSNGGTEVKPYALTLKQFKDTLNTIAGYEEKDENGNVVKQCPPLVAEFCGMTLDLLAGKTPIEVYTRWMQQNIQGPVAHS